MRWIDSNTEFAQGLGTGLGHSFPSLGEKIQEEVLRWIDTNVIFAEAAAIGIVDIFGYLEKDQRERILALAARSHNLAKAFRHNENKDKYPGNEY